MPCAIKKDDFCVLIRDKENGELLATKVIGGVEQDDFGFLATASGEYVFVKTDTASGCDYPTMTLTVTGSSGTVNWCGETWVLPGDSGTQKSVCPSNYTLLTSGSDLRHTWGFGGPSTGSLNLERTYQTTLSSGINRIFLNYGSGRLTDYHAGITLDTFQIGVLSSGSALPSGSSYTLNSNFFGSYTFGGITYAWEKGDGWP